MRKFSTLLIAALLTLALLLPFVTSCSGENASPVATSTAPTTASTTTSAPAPSAESIKWTVQLHVNKSEPYGHWGLVQHDAWTYGWADWIEKVTQGRLTIEFAPTGSLFPDASSYVGIEDGVADAAWSVLSYFAGDIPECYVAMGLPMSSASVAEAHDLWYGYGMYDLMKPIFEAHNQIMIPSFHVGHMSLWTTFPTPDIASLEGKKIRTHGAWNLLVDALGASSVSMPFSDVYMALKLGTVEGCQTPATSLEVIKMKEVVTDHVNLINVGTNCFLINQDSFNALPSDIQDIILYSSPQFFLEGSCFLNQQEEYLVRNSPG